MTSKKISIKCSIFCIIALLDLHFVFAKTDFSSSSDDRFKKRSILNLTVGSFLYHVYNPSTDYTEYLGNRPVIIGVKTGETTYIKLGSFLNSFGHRAALIGWQKTWYQYKRFSIEGMYSYAGEFFFGTSKDLGEVSGPYGTNKKIFGFGWAPYIYSGVSYKVTPFLSVDVGSVLYRSIFIFGGIFITSLQWHLF